MGDQPDSFPTGHIRLSPSLLNLSEVLARHNHDIWAQGRLREGWRYGERRDDAAPTHPCLVPYEDLPESEKEVNRATALGVLQAMVALGYIILDAASSPELDEPVEEHLSRIEGALQANQRSLSGLRRIWQRRCAALWAGRPALFRDLARFLCQLGEPFFAHDVASEGLALFPHDVRLRQRSARALAQTGATHAAQAILEFLHRETVSER